MDLLYLRILLDLWTETELNATLTLITGNCRLRVEPFAEVESKTLADVTIGNAIQILQPLIVGA